MRHGTEELFQHGIRAGTAIREDYRETAVLLLSSHRAFAVLRPWFENHLRVRVRSCGADSCGRLVGGELVVVSMIGPRS